MDLAALEQRYDAELGRALAETGAAGAALAPGLAPRLPPAIGRTMRLAAELLGSLPESLAGHYLRAAPRQFVAQRLGGTEAGRALLRRPLARSSMPTLARAFDGAAALLREQGIDPRRALGAAHAGELFAGRPSALALASRSLLASGLPLLGAGPGDLDALAAALAAGERGGDCADALIDWHLGPHLLHELLHGPREVGAEAEGASGAAEDEVPWLLREAAALWLQSRAWPRHIFPEVAGEAVPGVSLFVLAGEGLATALGADALLSLPLGAGAMRARLGEAGWSLLCCAGWQAWLAQPVAPFARDALRAESWIKLAAGARALHERDADRQGRAALETLRGPLAAIEKHGPLRGASALPALLDLADAIPWPALPAWRAEPAHEDSLRARVAVRALFQENAMAPRFVTRPAELADGGLRLEVEACSLRAAPRARGVFGEPARWLFPPALCRRLHARGARQVELRGARRAQCDALAAALVAVASDAGPLAPQLVLEADALVARSGDR